MDIELKNQLLCSTIKFHDRTIYYGNANVLDISILTMIYDLLSSCMNIEHECSIKLNNLANHVISNSDYICAIRGTSAFVDGGNGSNTTITTLVHGNNAPTVNGNIITLDGELLYYFTPEQFKVNFNDVDGDLPELVRIESLPSSGALLFNNEYISEGFIFNISDANLLAYERIDDPYNDNFIFRTSDDNITNKLFSNMANFTITVEGKINQPPVVGDGTASSDYNTPITFTRAMFTTNTTPPYSDPEGDAALKLKITVLPATGTIKLSGVAISANAIIDFTDIDAGLLTFSPDPAQTSTHVPSFTFGIADAGSNIFSF